MRETWKNRIVGYDVVEADQLLAHPSNWRIHPKAQQDALTGVLDDVGWVQEIIVNKTTGHVVDGHMRVEVALTRGESVPVKYVELSEAEEQLILATIDPISAMAGADNEQTVWDIKLDERAEGGHSTQKPLECMARPIRNHDAPIIYDPFLGSGTTLVACEQTGRLGRGIEIEPKYVAVILQRMADMGLEPRLSE